MLSNSLSTVTAAYSRVVYAFAEVNLFLWVTSPPPEPVATRIILDNHLTGVYLMWETMVGKIVNDFYPRCSISDVLLLGYFFAKRVSYSLARYICNVCVRVRGNYVNVDAAFIVASLRLILIHLYAHTRMYEYSMWNKTLNFHFIPPALRSGIEWK